jgi:hypothetical protein
MTESQHPILISEEPTERAVVARGRTVVVPDLSAPSVFAGREADTHREIFAPGTREVLSGEEVEMSRGEVKRLRSLGFLVDPDAVEVKVEGPNHYASLGLPR